MAPITLFVRVVALALIALDTASAQVAPAPEVARAAAAPPPRVEWLPRAPRQGSVVRITIRPPAAAPATTDSSRRDATTPALAGAARRDSVAPAAALDSLRALLDSLALRPVRDSLRAEPDSLRLSSDSARGVADSMPVFSATLFGEPLHFVRDSSGEYSAIAGIPVDAPSSVNLVITSSVGGSADTITARMAIGRTAYKMEQLTVAPRFGQAPDSALAARIAREQALAAGVSRKSHFTPRLWEGEFRRPRAARVTSAFGDGRQFNGRVQSRHMGLDLAGAVGAPVLATNRGVVALVGDFYYAGNAVYLDHGAGLVTAYFHLSAVDVAQGDTVMPGTRIGRVGATGRVTGPHLHWVARYGSGTVDPSTLLEISGPAPAGRRAPVDSARPPARASESSRAKSAPGTPPRALPPISSPPGRRRDQPAAAG